MAAFVELGTALVMWCGRQVSTAVNPRCGRIDDEIWYRGLRGNGWQVVSVGWQVVSVGWQVVSVGKEVVSVGWKVVSVG